MDGRTGMKRDTMQDIQDVTPPELKGNNLPPTHRATPSVNPKRTRATASHAFGRRKDPDFDRSLPVPSSPENGGNGPTKRLFNPDRDDAMTFNPQVAPPVDPGPRLYDESTPYRRKEMRKHPGTSEQRPISIVQRNDAAGEPRAKDKDFPQPSVAVLAPHESEERLRMVRQPETRPISPEQLICEVKGIYAGLIMVEAKCCEVDAKQHQAALEMDGRQPTLNIEQWQALIALHRTLLHEQNTTTRKKHRQYKTDNPMFDLFGFGGTGGFIPGMFGLAGKHLGKIRRRRSGLNGKLNGHPALALADSASWSNVMTKAYASRHNFLIDRSHQNIKDVPMATGSLHIIGKVTVEWTFEDEPDNTYIIDFDVASKSVHDIILGKSFLQKTKCLDEYDYRLVPMPSCRPGRNILGINSIGELNQKLPMMARVPGQSRNFRMQGLPDTGAEGEVISEAYARKNNLKIKTSDTKFELPDGTIVNSIGRVRLDLSFEDEPGNCISTYFEVMRDCRHEIIFGHSFVFKHRIFSDNVHRLVNTIGQLGLNAITFLKKRNVDADSAAHYAAHAIAMANRTQRRAGQSCGLTNIPSTAGPAFLGQNLAQSPPKTTVNAPSAHIIHVRPRQSWWRRVFCLR
ncbi:hypothetical protein K440DRAFT_656956 [Wilcoxina mikolae CBS 423.85]|nr:hypothetical protein K440DRAFT_656956 [Wilcoxina mikolae CBS 423.85]